MLGFGRFYNYIIQGGILIHLIDYAFKSEVIKSGLPNIQKQVSKTFYAEHILHTYGEVINCALTFDEALILSDYYSNYESEAWEEASRINHASYKRVKRLKDRIARMLSSGTCLFLTFTFTNDVLKRTKMDTRRQKVRRFLSAYSNTYIANIDFGKKNGREHYHALILLEEIDYRAYSYGALNGQRVRSTNDFERLAKYISKLTNHAIKNTSRGFKIVYSRGFE